MHPEVMCLAGMVIADIFQKFQLSLYFFEDSFRIWFTGLHECNEGCKGEDKDQQSLHKLKSARIKNSSNPDSFWVILILEINCFVTLS